MEFSESLNAILRNQNIKQADLCRMTGISIGLMSGYCTGKTEPSLTKAIVIADALQITLDELAGREPPKKASEKKLLSDFRQLTDEGQEVVSNLAYSLRMTYGMKEAGRKIDSA